jgi:two-component system response regulator GlrR
MKPTVGRILLVDDDTQILQLLAMRLSASGYAVTAVESGDAALASMAVTQPQVVITDLRMEGMDGMALFDAIYRQAPTVPVIILTAHGSIPEAVTATRRGVYGFLTKPVDSQELLETVADALRISVGPNGHESASGEIITRAPSMTQLLARAQRVAASDVSVCILGASGTGKELLARAIHRWSPRARMPFVAVNCGAIPEGLLESELFGHKKGSFTGATQDREGLFRAAQGGTLFLDEVGDMPLALQVKLLRAIEEKQVRRVGSNEAVSVDVRIISATHRQLADHVAQGKFREDLYYRLKVVDLPIPPLSERREDIPLLARHFLERLSRRYERPRLVFSREAIELLVAASWPGNVRQLLNVIEQAVALTTTDVIPGALVSQALDFGETTLVPFDDARRAFERDYLTRLLKTTSGSVTFAARLAGRNRTEFYRLLERHQLQPAAFR